MTASWHAEVSEHWTSHACVEGHWMVASPHEDSPPHSTLQGRPSGHTMVSTWQAERSVQSMTQVGPSQPPVHSAGQPEGGDASSGGHIWGSSSDVAVMSVSVFVSLAPAESVSLALAEFVSLALAVSVSLAECVLLAEEAAVVTGPVVAGPPLVDVSLAPVSSDAPGSPVVGTSGPVWGPPIVVTAVVTMVVSESPSLQAPAANRSQREVVM